MYKGGVLPQKDVEHQPEIYSLGELPDIAQTRELTRSKRIIFKASVR